MAEPKVKTEHNGAKNGGGGWGHRADMKRASKKRRRAQSKKAAVLHPDFWASPDEMLARQRGRTTPKRGR